MLENSVAGRDVADHGKPPRAEMIPTARKTSGTAVKYGKEPRESNAVW
jgi:hypothetical protein